MRADARPLVAMAATCLFLSSGAMAGETGWAFSVDNRDHPLLAYSEDGKNVLSFGCGRAFGILARYPAETTRTGSARIEIGSGRRRMAFKGDLEPPENGPGPSGFVQYDLGYRRQDPELFGKKWEALKNRLFDLLDSKKPVTVSAGDKRYVLPPVDAPDWKARFNRRC